MKQEFMIYNFIEDDGTQHRIDEENLMKMDKKALVDLLIKVVKEGVRLKTREAQMTQMRCFFEDVRQQSGLFQDPKEKINVDN